MRRKYYSFLLVFVVAWIIPTIVLAKGDEPPCSICGDGQQVHNPDGQFSWGPQQETVNCGELEEEGRNGDLGLMECTFLPHLLSNTCGCGPQEEEEEEEVVVVSTRESPPIFSVNTNSDTTTTPIFSVNNNDNDTEEDDNDTPMFGVNNNNNSEDDTPLFSLNGPLFSDPLLLSVDRQQQQPPDCPFVPPTGCSVCGDGRAVGNPEAIFDFPGQPAVKCDLLQIAGVLGQIPLDQCQFLPPLLEICECTDCQEPPNIIPTPRPTFPPPPTTTRPPTNRPTNPPTNNVTTPPPTPLPTTTTRPPTNRPTFPPTPLPTRPPTNRPTNPPTHSTPAGEEPQPQPCPSISPTGCSVCGNGLTVGNPNAIFVLFNMPPVLCADLEQYGAVGGILAPDQCERLPTTSEINVCECRACLPDNDNDAPRPPTPEPTPTRRPTPLPTNMFFQTLEPTRPPTREPTLPPTRRPTQNPTTTPTTTTTTTTTTTQFPFLNPTRPPTSRPTRDPTNRPTNPPTFYVYIPDGAAPQPPPTRPPFRAKTPVLPNHSSGDGGGRRKQQRPGKKGGGGHRYNNKGFGSKAKDKHAPNYYKTKTKDTPNMNKDKTKTKDAASNGPNKKNYAPYQH
eukprot:CAMPEP_0178923818 /NCGR_PEP_ID=MMETSP0786-20121207/16971_1 /TAXON_ID=186022 /ORGANISM="Thalassionema frauenfeldii, Strain CCMP 1798" /LENGTH=616 /DNA_ID=CAMNT_0020598437 /DNA_START=130 /DNA_END=1980 /DNA_ORIENTATION=-